ncbi:hypothetical protein [Breoghania sp. L-A4]|uniref:hypothetical protein n=1 Tax=Breoghania sp. L-A4 TaxID=2304600 RepID=UPI000E35F9B0|nr:hypothetical protein [Breoghania sp. L-A4]AXS40202.1 hypothetical protein D1F64_09210 [Breoghania sp. L-A4]
MNTQTPFDEILKDPRAHFDKPASVLSSSLDSGKKRELLERWEQDERALVRAAGESPMTGGEQPMLRDVELALSQLDKTN